MQLMRWTPVRKEMPRKARKDAMQRSLARRQAQFCQRRFRCGALGPARRRGQLGLPMGRAIASEQTQV